ncbi:Uncharacterized protein APZ42_014526 [Daphnia magna]|uniref:Uncharacterized protein n=1 Tax=Daphnia magna TaxID=35525 RepID=A0A162CVZ5_9CRUS|nr:Uncharacterized protein APZ42_014526 [Daphnia magna]
MLPSRQAFDSNAGTTSTSRVVIVEICRGTPAHQEPY